MKTCAAWSNLEWDADQGREVKTRVYGSSSGSWKKYGFADCLVQFRQSIKHHFDVGRRFIGKLIDEPLGYVDWSHVPILVVNANDIGNFLALNPGARKDHEKQTEYLEECINEYEEVFKYGAGNFTAPILICSASSSRWDPSGTDPDYTYFDSFCDELRRRAIEHGWLA